MSIITDPVFYMLAVPAVIALGLSKGGFSGIGTIAAPLMAIAVPPIQAIGILTPILLTQDVVTLWSYWRKWDLTILKIMVPGQIAGAALAWLIAAQVPDSAIRLVIGLVAVGFVASQWFGLAVRFARQHDHPSATAGQLWGAASGFTSLIANTGAPPFQIYVLPQKLDKETFVGTFSLFIAIGNALKILPYFMMGQLNPTNLATSATLLPLAVVTNIAGVWLVRRTPVEAFYKIIYLLIFLIGLQLIYAGTMEALGG